MGGKHNRTTLPNEFSIRKIKFKFASGAVGSFTGCLVRREVVKRNSEVKQSLLTFFDFDTLSYRKLLAEDIQTPITAVKYPTDVMRMAVKGCVEVLKRIETDKLSEDCAELVKAKELILNQRDSYDNYKLVSETVGKYSEQVTMLYDGTYRVELRLQSETPFCRINLLSVPLQLKIDGEVLSLYTKMNIELLRKFDKYIEGMCVYFDATTGCPLVCLSLELSQGATRDLSEFVTCIDVIKKEFKHI